MNKIVTFFMPHYFHGEYDLTLDLELPGFVVQQEIEPESWRKAIEWGFGCKPDDEEVINGAWTRFIREKYPEAEIYLDGMQGPQTLLHITWDREFITPNKIALACKMLAAQYSTEAQGDDDTFDYCPNTMRVLSNICIAIGDMRAAEDILELVTDLENGYSEDADENGEDGPVI